MVSWPMTSGSQSQIPELETHLNGNFQGGHLEQSQVWKLEIARKLLVRAIREFEVEHQEHITTTMAEDP